MRLFAFVLAALAFGAQAAITARARRRRPPGERLGELRDFEVDLATGELRRVPVQKLLAPASDEALVLNIEQREELP